MKPFDVYSIFDIEIARAEGSVLWDKTGKAYLDLYGGHAVISIGHSHPDYVQALTDQIKTIGFYSNSIRIPQQEELAAKLGELSGYTDYSLFLCNSGAEANENAFKLASFCNGRKKIIAFNGSFHGRTSLAVSATDNKNIVAPVNQNDNICFLPLNDLQRLEEEMDDTVSSVIVEGIQGVGGIHVPTTEFLKKIESLCQRFGAMMILDEVQSGYGRSGKFFAHQWSGVKPDLITVAKGMGNGFPVAGVLISSNLPARKEMLGTTFGGNYLACAAAISVLDIIKKENLMLNAQRMGDYLYAKLQDIPQIKELRGLGLMIGIELQEACAEIRKDLLFKHGIFTGSASNKNTIRLLPSLAVKQNELDTFIESLTQSLAYKNEILYNG